MAEGDISFNIGKRSTTSVTLTYRIYPTELPEDYKFWIVWMDYYVDIAPHLYLDQV